MNVTNATTESQLRIRSLALLSNNKSEFFTLLGCGLLAMLTNPLIIWTIWRQKSLHTGCFSIIAQLALADFFVGLSYTITMTKRFIRLGLGSGEFISRLQCSFEMTFNYFSESASLCLALAIGFERLLGATKPFFYNTHEWKIARVTSAIAWLIPTLDCCSMLIVMLSSDAAFVVICTASSAVTTSFFSLQQIEKTCTAAAIIVTYCLAVLTISIQLRAAKKKNSQSLAVMKKYLQLKMVRLLIALAVVYLVLQVATRIWLLCLAKLPPEQQVKIAPPLRSFMVLNSGIHLFVYIRHFPMEAPDKRILQIPTERPASISALHKSEYKANIGSQPHLEAASTMRSRRHLTGYNF